MVREDLLDLVMSGAWRSSSERRVVKYDSRRSVRMTVGFVMRKFEFRSYMVVDFIEAAICKGSSWRGRIRNDIYDGEYRNVVGGDHDGGTDDRV